MIDLAVLPGFLAAVTLVTVAPGPDNAYIAAVAASRGVRAGILSAVGMALGMVVHVTAAAVGLAALLRAAPAALVVIQVGGAGYLAVLAVVTLRAARRSGMSGHPAPLPGRRLLGRAALTNLTNPKVILFFAAFLPQFVRPGHGPRVLQLLVLGGLFLLVGFVSDSVIGAIAGRFGRALAAGSRAATGLHVLAGLTFAVLAAALVVDVVRT